MHRYDILVVQLGFATVKASLKEINACFLGNFPQNLERASVKGKSISQNAENTISGQDKIAPNYLLVLNSALTDEVSLQQVLLDCIQSKVREENPDILQDEGYKQAMFSLMHEVFSVQPATTPVKDKLLKLSLVCSDKALVDKFCEEFTEFNHDTQKLEFKPGLGKHRDSDVRSDPLLFWPLPGAFKEWGERWTIYYKALIPKIGTDSYFALHPLIKEPNSLAKLNQIKWKSSAQLLGEIFQPVICDNYYVDLRSEHTLAICRILMLTGKPNLVSTLKGFPESFLEKTEPDILSPQINVLLNSYSDKQSDEEQKALTKQHQGFLQVAKERRLGYFTSRKQQEEQENGADKNPSLSSNRLEASLLEDPGLQKSELSVPEIDLKSFHYYPAQVHIVSVGCL